MTSQNLWLITGGAGYIGAHIADKFLENGLDVVIFDSLYSGLKSRVDFLSDKHGSKVRFVQGDIRDLEKFRECLLEFNPIGVIHTAALKSVEESIDKPSEYLQINFEATREILNLIKEQDIKKFIFSSTAAVYGSPLTNKAIKEDDPKNPISPYGMSKLRAEIEVERYSNGLDRVGISLRFFNVVGTASPELRDHSVDNLVPIVIERLERELAPIIFGSDYPTSDGTCIRDYVDVRDIANAHFMVAQNKDVIPKALNIGTGKGVSVKEVINLISNLIPDKAIEPIFSKRRPGDPGILYADVSLATKSMEFLTQYDLIDSLGTVVLKLKK